MAKSAKSVAKPAGKTRKKTLKKRASPKRTAVVVKNPAVPVAAPSTPGPAPGAETALVLDRLWATVLSRRNADPTVSHSARLLSRGAAKVAQKFGEEAVECLIEAVAGNAAAVVAESADTLYHLIVLWVASGVRPEQVWEELRRREGMSGIAEKAARSLPLAIAVGTRKIP